MVANKITSYLCVSVPEMCKRTLHKAYWSVL